MQPPSKQCAECGIPFTRPPNRSHAQWERMQFCGAVCANTRRARGRAKQLGDLDCSQGKAKYQRQWAYRRALPYWAQWWENHRSREDMADWEAMRRPIGPHCKLRDRPKVRYLLGCYCQSCREPFVYYRDRAQSRFCVGCNTAHHRRPSNRRAKQNGAAYEPIDPQRVFNRDQWRCQLCGRKTKGIFPAPRSPTLDHIVPLSKGGDHLYINVQCACFECNWRKADGAANDQLRLLA